MTTMIHAPRVRLEPPVTRSTVAQVTVPRMFSGSPRCQPCSRSRSQRATIPAWDMVKAVNTPTA